MARALAALGSMTSRWWPRSRTGGGRGPGSPPARGRGRGRPGAARCRCRRAGTSGPIPRTPGSGRSTRPSASIIQTSTSGSRLWTRAPSRPESGVGHQRATSCGREHGRQCRLVTGATRPEHDARPLERWQRTAFVRRAHTAIVTDRASREPATHREARRTRLSPSFCSTRAIAQRRLRWTSIPFVTAPRRSVRHSMPGTSRLRPSS